MLKKLLIICLLFFVLVGCNSIIPDDTQFFQTVQLLDSLEKIDDYVRSNFVYKLNILYEKSPYQLWKTKNGDCSDFARFYIFVANYHGYETYKVKVYFKNRLLYHVLAVFREGDEFTYSTNQYYHGYLGSFGTFREIVEDYLYYQNYYEKLWLLRKYIVYDYDGKIIEVRINGQIS